MDTHLNKKIKGSLETELLINRLKLELNFEKKLHSTMDNLLEGLQIIDYNWRYHYVNNTVVKQSKFSREELIGYTMMEKYPGIEKTKLFEELSTCMKGRVCSHFENEFTYPDGSKGWFDLSIQPADEGIIILSNDVTQRKKNEIEKIEYIQSIERLLFTLSHHLRQPIVQILGLVNLLKREGISKEESDKLIGFIQHSVANMDKCTREITHDLDNMNSKTKI